MTKSLHVSGTARPRVQFSRARVKLWIASLDRQSLRVQAQYNPKELQIDKSVQWGEHKARDNRSGHKRQEARSSRQDDLEFTGAPPRSMSIELLFDNYERGESVEPNIRVLEELSSVTAPESSDPDLRRPHHCLVTWGGAPEAMQPFPCVIESLSVKYTMWDDLGTPLRATCTVKLKEAHRISSSKDTKSIDTGRATQRFG